jgi:hypothetical protein
MARGSPNSLLESPEIKQITITQSNTATTVSRETTTTTTATDSNNATTTIEQRDNRESMVREEEEAKGLEKQDETNKQEAERQELAPANFARVESTSATFCSPPTVLHIRPTSPLSNDPATPAKPNHMLPEPAVTPIDGKMAENANETHFPTSFAKPSPNKYRKGSHELPVCATSPNPTSRSPNNAPVVAKPNRAPPKSTVTPPNNDMAAYARTPATGALSDGNPTASVPVNPVPVDPDPATTNIPTSPIHADPDPIVPVCITPPVPVHIDPVKDTREHTHVHLWFCFTHS